MVGLLRAVRRSKSRGKRLIGCLFRVVQELDGPPQKRYLDFLDILLTAKDDSGTGLTPLEIRSEVDTFLFEGGPFFLSPSLLGQWVHGAALKVAGTLPSKEDPSILEWIYKILAHPKITTLKHK